MKNNDLEKHVDKIMTVEEEDLLSCEPKKYSFFGCLTFMSLYMEHLNHVFEANTEDNIPSSNLVYGDYDFLAQKELMDDFVAHSKIPLMVYPDNYDTGGIISIMEDFIIELDKRGNKDDFKTEIDNMKLSLSYE